MITSEEKHFIIHQGRGFTITIRDDDEGITPETRKLKIPLSVEDIAAWQLGHWKYITVLVNATDEHGKYLEAGDLDVVTGDVGYRSDADLSLVARDLCDAICDGLDEAGVKLSHPPSPGQLS